MINHIRLESVCVYVKTPKIGIECCMESMDLTVQYHQMNIVGKHETQLEDRTWMPPYCMVWVIEKDNMNKGTERQTMSQIIYSSLVLATAAVEILCTPTG